MIQDRTGELKCTKYSCQSKRDQREFICTIIISSIIMCFKVLEAIYLFMKYNIAANSCSIWLGEVK